MYYLRLIQGYVIMCNLTNVQRNLNPWTELSLVRSPTQWPHDLLGQISPGVNVGQRNHSPSNEWIDIDINRVAENGVKWTKSPEKFKWTW